MKRVLGGLVPLALAAACGGQAELPARGEALVVVDTDLPVPALASRLRVDLYTEDGRWIESRDIGRESVRDWPASFSVVSSRDDADERVLVRLRAHREGLVRDYLGERFEPKPTVTPPAPLPQTIQEACDGAPEVPLAGRLTMRAGETKLTDAGPSYECRRPSRAGSAVAKVVVPQAGNYRFSIADAVPYDAQLTLSLRRACTDAQSQVTCSDRQYASSFSPGHFPRFDALLDPGTYWLVTSGPVPFAPADVTFEWLSLDGPLAPLPPSSSDAPTPTPAISPRLASERDVTPVTEPLPTASVDRLLLLRLSPGTRGTASVVLRGACTGTMAKIGPPGAVVFGEASTCVDREDQRVAVTETTLEPGIQRATGGSLAGTWDVAEECPARNDADPAVCVPGGAFVFGSREPSAFTGTIGDATPERIAVVPRFWMDRTETSVGEVRRLVEEHRIAPSAYDFVPSEAALDAAIPGVCTFAWTRKDRDALPMTCVSWRFARAVCRAKGGDLPTEVEWEYAALAAGRPFPTRRPWGDERATCDVGVWGRPLPGASSSPNACPSLPAGPVPVFEAGGTNPSRRDETPLGIVGLFGNVAEWTRDAGESYRSDCWRAAPLVAPRCEEEAAPFHVVRGSAWPAADASLALRYLLAAGVGGLYTPDVVASYVDLGFRCAYPERPAR